jgi:hypothetical protein
LSTCFSLAGFFFRVQTAALAERKFTADLFSVADEQGMVFVEKIGVSRKVRHKKQLIAGIAMVRRSHSHPVDDTPGISVDDENRLVAGIEYDGVGGFLSDSINIQELLSQVFYIAGKKLVEVVVITLP